MHRDFGISDEDWNATPHTALAHQLRLFRIRFSAYEKKMAGLEERAEEVESLRTEVSALRERLGQNSSNSRYRLPPTPRGIAARRGANRVAGSKALKPGTRARGARSEGVGSLEG